MNDAVKLLRENGEDGADLVMALSSSAVGWALLGQQEQGTPLLDEAVKLSQKLTDARVHPRVLNMRGVAAALGGKTADAVALLTDAAQKAAASGDRYLTLETKLNLARVQLQAGRAQPAQVAAKATAAEATKLGLKYLAADASLIAGQALVSQKSYAAARSTLDDALTQAERLGARPLQLQAHYALGTLLRLTKQSTGDDLHLREAARLLGELRKDAGDDALLRRPDLASIAAEAVPLATTSR